MDKISSERRQSTYSFDHITQLARKGSPKSLTLFKTRFRFLESLYSTSKLLLFKRTCVSRCGCLGSRRYIAVSRTSNERSAILICKTYIARSCLQRESASKQSLDCTHCDIRPSSVPEPHVIVHAAELLRFSQQPTHESKEQR